MTTARQFILAVIVSLLIAAVVLSPRREEREAMLAGEGRHRDAIALLESRLAGAPGDPEILAALGRSHAALGETLKAIEDFDAYLAVRPDDYAARNRLAELLLRSGQTNRYLDVLAQAVAGDPSRARVTMLVELYDLHRRVRDEINTLQTYAAKEMLDVTQLERLGALLAERGDWRDAQQWLEVADQKASADASAGRLLLLEVLIHNSASRIDERAQAWITAWRSPFLSGKVILRLAETGHVAAASRLAVESASLMPNDALGLVGFLAGKGHQDIAQRMLVQWANGLSSSDETELHKFVQASALLGDSSVPLRKFLQVARSGSDAPLEGQLAEEMVETFGGPATQAIRPLLSNEALEARPLFAAELSLSDDNRELARWYLNRVDPARLPPKRLMAWLEISHRIEPDADMVRRVTALSREGRVPVNLVRGLVEEAARLNQAAADARPR
jgi:tetratricopeptide (TPR) repeat protein